MIRRHSVPVALGVVALSAGLLAGCAPSAQQSERDVRSSSPSATTPAPSPSPTVESAAAVESQLRYLIEEEKLAHDVYVVLGEFWGTRVFENIAASESTHEAAVADLLPAYGVEDPRASERGVFTEPALQALYDDLIDAGSRSREDAIQVGVTIEKTDIADLAAALTGAPEDVAVVLERLLAASENHLAAFERQT
ncbi:MAG: DUF2202 domain-containing protein [Microbacterium sp.]